MPKTPDPISPAPPPPSGGRWFVAVLVFESHLDGDPDYEPMVDLQYRLVRAADAESAYTRALDFGEAGQHSYRNPLGETCAWRFAGLRDLQEVEDEALRDGSEVYGFIRDGSAAEWVEPKASLTTFLGRS